MIFMRPYQRRIILLLNCRYVSMLAAMKSTPKPLPYPLPPHFAELLEIDPTHLYRINNGERHPSVPLACKIMNLARKYPGLAGLSFYHLRPELEEARSLLCEEGPHAE